MRAAISNRSHSAARIFSIVGLPPVLALPTALLAAMRSGATPSTFLSVGGFLITGCVLPTVLTLVLVRRGHASAIDLRERGERLLPATVTAVGCAGAAWVLWRAGAPPGVCQLALAVSMQMALLAALTLRWKVSYHTASATALLLVGRSVSPDGLLSFGLLLLAIGIAWARVYQRRHTPAQVIVGALTAAPLVLLT